MFRSEGGEDSRLRSTEEEDGEQIAMRDRSIQSRYFSLVYFFSRSAVMCNWGLFCHSKVLESR